jgi:hypothetical protein
MKLYLAIPAYPQTAIAPISQWLHDQGERLPSDLTPTQYC